MEFQKLDYFAWIALLVLKFAVFSTLEGRETLLILVKHRLNESLRVLLHTSLGP